MEADEKMVLAGILHWDKEGMHATFKCPHADGKKKKKHLLIMLTKHNYANCHHNYMCTSRWNYSQLLSNCEASPNLCYTFITRCNHFFCCILLVNKHFHEHAITVVPKT